MNIGGYDKNAFTESDGNALLTTHLQSNRLIKTHFTESDKTPNFDGYFEICEPGLNKVIPVGTINVQIKTLERNYINKNKRGKISDYKYSCESKIFNAVMKGVSLDPAFLFLIDVKKRIYFAIYVSQEYVLELDLKDEKHKTVFFNDIDIIDDLDTFYDSVKSIYEMQKKKLTDGKSTAYTISDKLDTETKIELQKEIDQFNNLLDNELNFIKTHQYPEVWKFGIAYIKREVSSVIGIYQIKKGCNDTFIKVFDNNDQSNIFITSYKNDYINIHQIIKNHISSMVSDYFAKAYIEPKYLPTVALEEISYQFLDEVARCCKHYENKDYPSIYYKDSESLEVIENYWSALVELSNNFWYELKSKGMHTDVKDCPFDPFGAMHIGPCVDILRENFFQLTQNKDLRHTYSFNLIIQGRFGYRLLRETLEELRLRNIIKVSRVWKHEDFINSFKEPKTEKGIRLTETGFMVKDYYINLRKLFSIIPECYDQVSSKLFGKYHEILKIKKEYIIRFNESAKYTYSSIVSRHDSLSIKFEEYSTVNIDDFEQLKRSYPFLVWSSSGRMDHIFQCRTPLYYYISLMIYYSISEYLGIKFENKLQISFVLD